MESISDLGLINLIGGIIRITAQDIRYGSGVVYSECINCMSEVKPKDYRDMICTYCGSALVYCNETAESFLESELFEDLASVIDQNTNKVKWLIRNKKVSIRRNCE